MEFEICKSFWSQSRGLMFSRKKNLVFVLSKPRRVGLHMFFVFFPIDVLFLDKDKRVIEMKLKFKPFRIYTSLNEAKYVVEISEKHKYKIGDIISF